MSTNTRLFQSRPWEQFAAFIENANYTSVFLVTDTNTEKHCLESFRLAFGERTFVHTRIDAGERCKTLEACTFLWREWQHAGIERRSIVIALGGGVVCDLVGFSAACILRGVDCAYVPTTLMAMADAAWGGKCGVNLDGAKNAVGLFRNPVAVLVDPVFLQTLSNRHKRNGFVEMIKHSLLQDPPFWQSLQALDWPIQEENMDSLLRQSLRVKREITEADPLERNLRKALNLGHTIGHALESCALDEGRDLLHGEAVALGLLGELYLSAERYAWKPGLLEGISGLLRKFLPAQEALPSSYEALEQRLSYDKKRSEQRILFSLLERPGKPVWDVDPGKDGLHRALDYIRMEMEKHKE